MKDGILIVRGTYNTYRISMVNVLYIDTDTYGTMTVKFVNGTDLKITYAKIIEDGQDD